MIFSALHQDFVSKGNNISYEFYRQIFAAENIGFGENRTDDCEVCLQFEQHKKEVLGDHVSENCEICAKSTLHLEKARVSRQKYRAVIEEPNIFTFDMQKVIFIPKLTTEESFFASRLVCFNKTFACGKKAKKLRNLVE